MKRCFAARLLADQSSVPLGQAQWSRADSHYWLRLPEAIEKAYGRETPELDAALAHHLIHHPREPDGVLRRFCRRF